jgi:hypothetical protein
MISVSKETAFNWLWGTTFINLGLGAVLWVFNSVALQNYVTIYSPDAVNAVAWQTIGSGLWGFGVLVFMITLATSAIVDALGGNGSTPKRPKAKNSSTASSAKNWLSE